MDGLSDRESRAGCESERLSQAVSSPAIDQSRESVTSIFIQPPREVIPIAGRVFQFPAGNSDSLARAVPVCALALVALLDEVIHQLAGGVVHFHVEGFYAAAEVVEGHNGRDGDEQSECRGDQRLRDTAGNRADT